MADRQRIVVTGAQGNLGQDILRVMSPETDIEWIGTGRAELDLTWERERIHGVLNDLQPDVIVNCASFTDVDGSESRYDEAFRVNGDGPRALSEWAADNGPYVIHISTDYVFDGKKGVTYDPSDIPNPINLYGKSKLAGEAAILSMIPDNGVVVRTSWLYGSGQRGFVWFLIRAAQNNTPVNIANDQWGSPTWTDHLVKMLWEIIETRPTGILHGCNRGMVTRYEQARFIFEQIGGDVDLLNPIPTENFHFAATRPRNTAMDSSFFWAPDWQTGTIDFLKQKGLYRVHV